MNYDELHKKLHRKIDAAYRYAERVCARSTEAQALEHIRVQAAYRAGQRYSSFSKIARRNRSRPNFRSRVAHSARESHDQ